MQNDWRILIFKVYQSLKIPKILRNANQLYWYSQANEWQDEQNTYHKEKIANTLRELRAKFEKYAVEKYPYLKKFKKQTLYSLYFLNECPILNIDTIAKFYHTYIFKSLSSIIGGKNLGLVRLKANNITIPQTFIIPVGSLEYNRYMSELTNLPNMSYAIRSSATVEDGDKHSFAGLFNTELNIQKQNLSSMILNVRSSVSSERVVAYVNKFKTDQPHMSIVLQEYIEPQYAGVWMGESLESGHLEYVTGNGEKLVSGKSNPTYEYWKNKKQRNVLKFGRCSAGRFLMKLQKNFNSTADFEFCIKDDRLILLQYRPVTKTFAKINVNYNNNTQVVGIPASCGKVSGEPIFLSEKPSFVKDLRNKILLADFADPEWAPALMEVSAIVTAEGGMLCHAAIIARELGILCICGVGYENIDLLAKKSMLFLDGNKGIIRFDD